MRPTRLNAPAWLTIHSAIQAQIFAQPGDARIGDIERRNEARLIADEKHAESGNKRKDGDEGNGSRQEPGLAEAANEVARGGEQAEQ